MLFPGCLLVCLVGEADGGPALPRLVWGIVMVFGGIGHGRFRWQLQLRGLKIAQNVPIVRFVAAQLV
jgi:hypothetical protein